MMAFQNQSETKSAGARDELTHPEVIAEILSALRGLRYGSLEIRAHDSRVVQIEKKEKVRLNRKVAGEAR
jgi:hypothetical protein